MNDIFLYFVDIPGTVREMVVPCYDGYTIYIDVKLSYEEKLMAYNHAMQHIERGDFQTNNTADQVEARCHGEETL